MAIDLPITARVRFGASLWPVSGTVHETVTLAEPATVADVLAEVGRLHPGLVNALSTILPVIGGAQRPTNWPVKQGDEVAILVAISGG